MSDEVKTVKVNIDDLENIEDLAAAYAKYINGVSKLIRNPEYVENSIDSSTRYKYQHLSLNRYENLRTENYILSAAAMYLMIKGHRLDLISDYASPATWHVSSMFSHNGEYFLIKTHSSDPIKAVMKAVIKKCVHNKEELELPE